MQMCLNLMRCMFSGCKMNNINVVYTPWANLKKTGDMDVGQIGFHRQKEVSRPGFMCTGGLLCCNELNTLTPHSILTLVYVLGKLTL